MNILDIIILIILVYFAVRGLFRGFIQEVFALGGLILGVAAAARYHDYFTQILFRYIHNSDMASVAAYVLVFLVVAAAMAVMGRILSRFIRFLLLGWLDRPLGAAVGLMKGLIITCIVVLVVGMVAGEEKAFVRNSRLKPLVESFFFFVPKNMIDKLKAKRVSVQKHLEEDSPSRLKQILPIH
jgi:membrane protein required for colicin V production